MHIQKIDLPIPPLHHMLPLPFEGLVQISQGFNGPYSHFAWRALFDDSNRTDMIQDDRFAVDFLLEPNTPIRAVMAGTVQYALDCFTEYYEGIDRDIGLRCRTNSLIIDHLDGTSSLYSHLNTGSICVKAGENVSQGMYIAQTGKSGWIGLDPHLHFELMALTRTLLRRSLPVTFEGYTGPLEHRLLFPEENFK